MYPAICKLKCSAQSKPLSCKRIYIDCIAKMPTEASPKQWRTAGLDDFLRKKANWSLGTRLKASTCFLYSAFPELRMSERFAYSAWSLTWFTPLPDLTGKFKNGNRVANWWKQDFLLTIWLRKVQCFSGSVKMQFWLIYLLKLNHSIIHSHRTRESQTGTRLLGWQIDYCLTGGR